MSGLDAGEPPPPSAGTAPGRFIRSCFEYGQPHPASDGRERSTLVMQRIRRFLGLYDSGAYRDYRDVCTRDYM